MCTPTSLTHSDTRFFAPEGAEIAAAAKPEDTPTPKDLPVLLATAADKNVASMDFSKAFSSRWG